GAKCGWSPGTKCRIVAKDFRTARTEGTMPASKGDARIADLDEVVLQALDLHSRAGIPVLRLPPARRRLVVASGNALAAGRIPFADEPALFASESHYQPLIDSTPDIDHAVVISASGTKHAP